MEATVPKEMYDTTNSTYGLGWHTGESFRGSFTQSTPYKTLTYKREVKPSELPEDRHSLSLVQNPRHPCGIMSLSNVPTNTRGEFTYVRRDLYADSQVSMALVFRIKFNLTKMMKFTLFFCLNM